MLSRGFKDQIYDIFRTLPGNIQVLTQRSDSSYYHLYNKDILEIFQELIFIIF